MLGEKSKLSIPFTIYTPAAFLGDISIIDEELDKELESCNFPSEINESYSFSPDGCDVDFDTKTITVWVDCAFDDRYSNYTKEEFNAQFENIVKNYIDKIAEELNNTIDGTIVDSLPNAHVMYYNHDFYIRIGYKQSTVNLEYEKTEILLKPDDFEDIMDDLYYGV